MVIISTCSRPLCIYTGHSYQWPPRSWIEILMFSLDKVVEEYKYSYMYVCMYVCMCVCVCMYVCMYVCMLYVYVCTCMYVHMYVWMDGRMDGCINKLLTD